VNSVPCALAGVCGGCGWPDRSPADARRDRVAALVDGLASVGVAAPPQVEVLDTPTLGFRDKFDFGLSRRDGPLTMGLSQVSDRAFLDVVSCPQLTPALAEAYARFRADPPPAIGHASLRLRVAPSGRVGLWIDAANADIKALLDERVWLRRQGAAGVVVELGQRRKEVVDLDGELKLRETPPRAWWQTEDAGQVRAVFGRVGGFSQPSLAIGSVLAACVRQAVAESGARTWLEVGCGAGNLTLAVAAAVDRVTAIDNDPDALTALGVGLAHAGLSDRVAVRQGNLDSDALTATIAAHEGVLVDPPRSGLRRLAQGLAEAHTVRALVYVSCNAASFAEDAGVLARGGWRLQTLAHVDQFPWSPHGEFVARWSRDSA
jgi:23S rRNA (uracil1939-C5)-methyltransferase